MQFFPWCCGTRGLSRFPRSLYRLKLQLKRFSLFANLCPVAPPRPLDPIRLFLAEHSDRTITFFLLPSRGYLRCLETPGSPALLIRTLFSPASAAPSRPSTPINRNAGEKQKRRRNISPWTADCSPFFLPFVFLPISIAFVAGRHDVALANESWQLASCRSIQITDTALRLSCTVNFHGSVVDANKIGTRRQRYVRV